MISAVSQVFFGCFLRVCAEEIRTTPGVTNGYSNPVTYKFPFNTKSPSSFNAYLNKYPPKDGKSIRFTNLRECRMNLSPGIGLITWGNYWCYGDIVEQSSLGKRVCINYRVSYYPPFPSFTYTYNGQEHLQEGRPTGFIRYEPLKSRECGSWK